MNEENRTERMVPDVDTLKGQAMYIYLPEGAVIVDRTQVNVAGIPQAEQITPEAAPQITPQVAPQVAPQYVQQLAPEQPRIQYLQEPQRVQYLQQPTPAFVQAPPQPQIQYLGQPHVAYVQPQVQYLQQPVGAAYLQDRPAVTYRRRQRRDHLVLRRRHRVNWVHTLNVAFASYVVAVTLFPFLLSAFTGVSLFSSKSTVPGLTVQRGELMVTHATPVSRLLPGDVVLLRDKNSWNLQIRELVSTSANGSLTSVFTNSGVDGTVSDVTTVESVANVHKVTSSIPIFGYFVTFFSSIFVKFLGAFIILVINLRHLYRRRRRRLIDEKVVFVANDPRDQDLI